MIYIHFVKGKMKKHLIIECGSIRKVVNIETELSEQEIVDSVDYIDLFKNARPISNHTFINTRN